nr:MAG TPA: hypothetical protein [Caudoviricetes sp.]
MWTTIKTIGILIWSLLMSQAVLRVLPLNGSSH